MSQKLFTFQHALSILTFNPGTQETKAGRFLSSRLVWFTTESSSITGLHRETLSQSQTKNFFNILYQFIHAIFLPKNYLILDSFPLNAYMCFHFLVFNVRAEETLMRGRNR